MNNPMQMSALYMCFFFMAQNPSSPIGDCQPSLRNAFVNAARSAPVGTRAPPSFSKGVERSPLRRRGPSHAICTSRPTGGWRLFQKLGYLVAVVSPAFCSGKEKVDFNFVAGIDAIEIISWDSPRDVEI